MTSEPLDYWHEQGWLSDLDVHFARFMARLSETDREELALAYALTSRARGLGHVCLDLGRPFESIPEGFPEGRALPTSEEWAALLVQSPVVGHPGEYRPLILSGRRLYLHRYWKYEQELIAFIQKRMNGKREGLETERLKEGLKRSFPSSDGDGPDWQQAAALVANLKPFCVISGGPGTGKTTIVAQILALFLDQFRDPTPRICLAAPTGKAAARLQEALERIKREMPVDEALKARFPTEARTLHRLLGILPTGGMVRQRPDQPLEADLVIVDEASMVDLALLARLTEALPDRSGLILLGDRNQLASVEAGAVLGDLCDTGRSHVFSRELIGVLNEVLGERPWPPGDPSGPGLQDCIVTLRRNYRFGADSGIGEVSRLANRGDGDSALARIQSPELQDINWRELPSPENLGRVLWDGVRSGFSPYLKETDPVEVFRQLEDFRILCALREGPYGVRNLNLLVEQLLKKEGLIHPEGRWYRGRPVMVMRNDYNLRLFNGDVGIILPDPSAGGELRAWFPGEKGAWRKFIPGRLPEHETVYALTVHKSQGSEFGRVLLVLPDRDSPVLTRELIYTGITRARQGVEIWGTEAVFCQAVTRRIRRSSGLREALWGP